MRDLPHPDQVVEVEEDLEQVFCGPSTTALLSSDGVLLVAGRNKSNMLGRDSGDLKVKQAEKFQVVAEELGPVTEVALGEACMVVLSKAGEVWVLGWGEERRPHKLVLATPGRVSRIAAGRSGVLVATEEGAVVAVWEGGREEQVALARRASKALRLLCSGDTVVAHMEMAGPKDK